ncbi:thioredoxin domain-containing protein [Candidatus Saccharibacteria bacterium]|nr:thioredoxin domain-containing protein [Candidatus Saccharibacteria bacterium]
MRNIITGVIIAAIVGLLGFATWKIFDGNSKMTNFNEIDFYSVIEPSDNNGNIGDHVKGNLDTAKIILFEYADYQCPGCAGMNIKVNKAIEQSEGKIALVYRSFLLSYHQNGTAAASAAEAAGLQGYWKPFADLLFANQSEWEYSSPSERKEFFTNYFKEATKGKGDVDKFLSDIGSPSVKKKIDFDMGIGKRIDVGGTPSFYTEGQFLDWSQPGSITINGKTITWDKGMGAEEDFIKLLNDILAAKEGN